MELEMVLERVGKMETRMVPLRELLMGSKIVCLMVSLMAVRMDKLRVQMMVLKTEMLRAPRRVWRKAKWMVYWKGWVKAWWMEQWMETRKGSLLDTKRVQMMVIWMARLMGLGRDAQTESGKDYWKDHLMVDVMAPLMGKLKACWRDERKA